MCIPKINDHSHIPIGIGNIMHTCEWTFLVYDFLEVPGITESCSTVSKYGKRNKIELTEMQHIKKL